MSETLAESLMRIREVCVVIQQDMEADVRDFTGKPFSGKTVGELHGNLAAGIAALAGMVSVLADACQQYESTGATS